MVLPGRAADFGLRCRPASHSGNQLESDGIDVKQGEKSEEFYRDMGIYPFATDAQRVVLAHLQSHASTPRSVDPILVC